MSKEELKLRRDLRKAFAMYWASEGCSCCRDSENHSKAENEIGKLLNAKKYEDGSGYDWSKYYKQP